MGDRNDSNDTRSKILVFITGRRWRRSDGSECYRTIARVVRDGECGKPYVVTMKYGRGQAYITETLKCLTERCMIEDDEDPGVIATVSDVATQEAFFADWHNGQVDR